jgi:hypothetical protein
MAGSFTDDGYLVFDFQNIEQDIYEKIAFINLGTKDVSNFLQNNNEGLKCGDSLIEMRYLNTSRIDNLQIRCKNGFNYYGYKFFDIKYYGFPLDQLTNEFCHNNVINTYQQYFQYFPLNFSNLTEQFQITYFNYPNAKGNILLYLNGLLILTIPTETTKNEELFSQTISCSSLRSKISEKIFPKHSQRKLEYVNDESKKILHEKTIDFYCCFDNFVIVGDGIKLHSVIQEYYKTVVVEKANNIYCDFNN